MQISRRINNKELTVLIFERPVVQCFLFIFFSSGCAYADFVIIDYF